MYTSWKFFMARQYDLLVCSIVQAPSPARCDEHGRNSATWQPFWSSSRHAHKNAHEHTHECHYHYYIIHVYGAWGSARHTQLEWGIVYGIVIDASSFPDNYQLQLSQYEQLTLNFCKLLESY